MRFLVDAQLPPALARWLAERGHTAEHVSDLGLQSADDRARSAETVIITKDEDFALRRTLTATGPAIVWVRLGNTRRRELLAWFEPLLPTVVDLLKRGSRWSRSSEVRRSGRRALVRGPVASSSASPA